MTVNTVLANIRETIDKVVNNHPDKVEIVMTQSKWDTIKRGLTAMLVSDNTDSKDQLWGYPVEIDDEIENSVIYVRGIDLGERKQDEEV